MAEALPILSLKPKRKDINKYRELDDEWYSLGTELEIDDEELDELGEKHSDDPHRRMIKVFGVWLEKGETPTYRKLLKALVNIGKRDVAESICTEIGLTSSLDSLLKTATVQVKLSERDSQTEKADAKPSEPMTDQTSTTSVSAAPAASHGPVSRGEFTQVQVFANAHAQPSKSIDKRTSTAPCDSETPITVKESQMHGPPMAAGDSSSEPAYKAMIHSHDKLVAALSTDILTISGVLLAKEFIPAEISNKMLLQNSTAQEKATIVVNAVTDKIKIAPKRFDELIKTFEEQTCTKDIVAYLMPSRIGCEQQVIEDRRQDAGVIISTSQQYSVGVGEGHMYTAWASLDPDDKTDLEARLLTDAENIGVKFAHLCSMARDSFEQRGITPQMLTDALKDLTVYKPGSSCHDIMPLLKEDGTLMKAQSVRDMFHALRPHMSFFNNEILQFLIERKGSEEDKAALTTFMGDFREFCRRHVFEVPFNSGNHFGNQKAKQRLHVKVTEHFQAALLIESTSKTLPFTNICSSKLGINLEDAKKIQRKLASILDLNPSSLFLDTISEGSVILTFLLPMCVSLAGLDNNPEIAQLSSNGIHILCGPAGKPKKKELTSKGLIVQWSQPEYGCPSLARYILYHQKKCGETKSQSEWQKLELCSLETHTCIPDLCSGVTYIFKICTLSDVGTLQYSDESDPIVISADGILTNNIHKVFIVNKDALTSAFLSADPNTIAAALSAKGVISKEDEVQISLTPTPSEKGVLLVTAIEHQAINKPQLFPNFLNALSEATLLQPVNFTHSLWSEYYDSVYTQYLDYIKFLYASLDKKQTSPDQWPPSTTTKFFRLAMIKSTEVKRGHFKDRFVRMTITGKVDDILREKYPVRLEDIFKETERQMKENEGQRKVILLDGAPGCGKSTLSVYICQQWEKDQLFNQFKLVILIRLRDPAIKNAKDLADLLPCPDTTTAQQIAARMLANKCRDVLFILDGWDELPPNLRENSIFNQLVQPMLPYSNPLRESTVIVTSRPIASGDLHQIVSSRVEILGFTAEELYQFFTECLKGDTEAVKTLLEKIEENPEVAGSCYLPLNATILVYLFKSDPNTLPTTLYGIFSSLVLNCIKRHLKLRTQYKDVSVESLDQLPKFTKKPFSILCQLAYDGVMEDKIIFPSLPADVNTLSLLQGVESFIGREKAVSHSFIHLSIQELLATWYIATQLPASEQVSKFNELFDKSRFSAVFQFYGAITKLKTPGIKEVVINVVKKYKLSSLPIEEEKVRMVSLLHCLYEAQNPSLCESIAQQLQYRLYIRSTTLAPSDCLCVGYFLANVCKMAASEFRVMLEDCSIGDQGCKYLVSGLHKYLDTHSAVITLLWLQIDSNAISLHGLHHLSTLLKIGCVCELILRGNKLVSNEDAESNTAFSIFAEQLKNNTTLRRLVMSRCGLNSQSAMSFAEVLTTNKQLKLLNVSDNALCDDGIQHLAHSLQVNQGLKGLDLGNCGMTDMGLECIAKSLQHNMVLYKLSIDDNKNITKKIVPVLTECLQNNHTLTQLQLPMNLQSSGISIEKAVNDIRKRNGLPLIQVQGVSVYV